MPLFRKKENVNSTKKHENRNLTLPVVRYFTQPLQLFSNILSVVVSGKSFSFLTRPRVLQTGFLTQF